MKVKLTLLLLFGLVSLPARASQYTDAIHLLVNLGVVDHQTVAHNSRVYDAILRNIETTLSSTELTWQQKKSGSIALLRDLSVRIHAQYGVASIVRSLFSTSTDDALVRLKSDINQGRIQEARQELRLVRNELKLLKSL